MTGSKRKSTDSAAANTRASKVAKSEASNKPSSKKGAKKAGAGLSAATFKTVALPVHVNLTHTPPTIAPDDEAVSVATEDPGYIGNLTLVPNTFSTGSFGWKGSKRLTVELENTEGGEKQKVQVMLSINATVAGSKPSKPGKKNDKNSNDDDNAEEEAEADEE